MNVSAIEIVNVCTYNEENHDKDIENDNNNNNSSTSKHKYKNFRDIQSQSIKSKTAAKNFGIHVNSSAILQTYVDEFKLNGLALI